MTPKTMPEELEPYRRAGMQLIPLHRWDATKLSPKGDVVHLGKAPLEKGWRSKLYSFEECQEHMRQGFNVGVRLRDKDIVLDVDPRNYKLGRDSLAEFVKHFGLDLEQYPCVLTGSGGFHYYGRKPEGLFLRTTTSEYPGLEFKSLGTQIVAAGSIHPNGKRYEWDFIGATL